VLAVARDKKGVVCVEMILAEGGQTVVYRLCGVVFVVDGRGARGRGEVGVCGLYLAVVVSFLGCLG
jgi:hypothetical protein